jgi:hypothetical protein
LQHIAQLSLVLTCLIALYVGVRTLMIWRRTRMIAEFMIGLNVFSIAIGGVILTALGKRVFEPEILTFYFIGLAALVVHVGAVAFPPPAAYVKMVTGQLPATGNVETA